MKEIRISDFGNIGLASIEDNEAKTGCTVIYFKDMRAAVSNHQPSAVLPAAGF